MSSLSSTVLCSFNSNFSKLEIVWGVLLLSLLFWLSLFLPKKSLIMSILELNKLLKNSNFSFSFSIISVICCFPFPDSNNFIIAKLKHLHIYSISNFSIF